MHASDWIKSNALGLIAIFIALSGTAIAQQRIGTNELKNRAVTAPKLANNSVVPRTIATNAIRPGKVATNAIRPRHIAPGAVGTTEIAPGAVTEHEIASDYVNGDPGTPSLRTLGSGSAQAAAGDDPRLTNARPPSGTAGGDLTGSYPNPAIGPLAVGTENLAASAVTAAKLANGAVPSKVTLRTDVKVSSANNDSLAVQCEPGEIATGGAAGVSVGNMEGVSYFFPGGQPQTPFGVPRGWTASWWNSQNHENTFRVEVICVA